MNPSDPGGGTKAPWADKEPHAAKVATSSEATLAPGLPTSASGLPTVAPGPSTAAPGVVTKAPWATAAPGESTAGPGVATKAPLATAGAHAPPPVPPTGVPKASSTPVLIKAPWEISQPHPAGATVPKPLHLSEPQMPQALPSRPPHGYKPAGKRIKSADDLKRCLESDVMRDFVAFILSLSEAVKGKKLSSAEAGAPVSPAITRLKNLLDLLSTWVDEIPPSQQSLRYGNPAYRTWFAKMQDSALHLVQSLLPEEGEGASSSGTAESAEGGSDAARTAERLKGCAVEVAPYLTESFGNATRIDYGTGHETNFCALLYCLARLGVVGEADREALVSVVFRKYLALMRKIQTTYWLEPAGSHGVWGLDDYQFLPFLWGASQLSGNPMIKPKSIHNQEIVEMYSDEYLYLACVRFVKQVKKGPFAETSPIINDISSVPSWNKVHGGMVKMYQVEVLSKFPIMQHFLFGSLLPFPE
eukprot:gene18678-25197_t